MKCKLFYPPLCCSRSPLGRVHPERPVRERVRALLVRASAPPCALSFHGCLSLHPPLATKCLLLDHLTLVARLVTLQASLGLGTCGARVMGQLGHLS